MNEKENYVLAIDVAKGKSMFFILSIRGEVILDAIEYKHTFSHFKMIDQIIGKEEIKEDLVVSMESTSTYHYPVMRFFIERDYDVIVVNPNLVKKKFHNVSKNEDGSIGCNQNRRNLFQRRNQK